MLTATSDRPPHVAPPPRPPLQEKNEHATTAIRPFIYTGQGKEDIPRDVTHVKVDPSVKAIRFQAFRGCSRLRTVNLGKALEEIGVGAFERCESLHEIVVSPSVKAIKTHAFRGCSKLTSVNLSQSQGLEEIGEGSFMSANRYVRSSSPHPSRQLRRMLSGVVRSCGLSILAWIWRRLGRRHFVNAHRYTRS